MPHSAAVAVVSVPPLRNSEQRVTSSSLLGADFLPSTFRSKRVSRYENDIADLSDPGFRTAFLRFSMSETMKFTCSFLTSCTLFLCLENNGLKIGRKSSILGSRTIKTDFIT
uniref:Uncharacterized protein n=1 Tax=Salix viminalis TaxID=40686 RepID=A0A6N2M0N1_SALVM